MYNRSQALELLEKEKAQNSVPSLDKFAFSCKSKSMPRKRKRSTFEDLSSESDADTLFGQVTFTEHDGHSSSVKRRKIDNSLLLDDNDHNHNNSQSPSSNSHQTETFTINVPKPIQFKQLSVGKIE